MYHSTIFRTIDENATGNVNKYGIRNSSYADIANAYNVGGIKGVGNSLSSFITSKDLDNIKEFNRLVSEEGVSSQTAWYKTMQTSSSAAKELFDNEENLIKSGNSVILSEEAISNATNTMTFSAKAGQVALKGLAIAGNMLLMWGITEAISALYKFSQVSKDVANSAQEIGSSFKETKKDINSYKEKVEELRGVINNSSSSVSEVTQARKDLMAVQDELIEKFGTEKESISAITEAINGQTGAWEKLTSKKWQEAKNEFNGKGGIIKDVSNLTKGYGDNIERMQDEYGNYEETIDLGSISGNENRQKAEELLKKFGEFSKTSAGIGQIKISGNATEVYEKILAIQETLDKMDVDFGKSFDKNLTDKANKVKDVSDKYKDFYNQFVLNEKILNDNEKGYSDYFNQITKDYDDYKKAVDSNDTTKISEKENAFAKQVVDSMNAAIENGDTDVADYFRNMYPELESIINDWDFKIKFSADTDNLKTDTQKAVDKLGGLSKEQLLDFNPKTATEKQKEGYSDLIALSEKYHMSISELIDILEKFGLVSSTFNKELISKYSPDETSDKDVKNAKQTLKEDKKALKDEYKKISDWGLDNYADQIKNKTIQTKFGNVDMDKRIIIHWSDELKKTYKDQLDSWDYDPEIGGIDSVFGGSMRVGENVLNEEGTEIAFSPILQTDDGAVFLSKQNVKEYLEALYKEAAKDGTVTEEEILALDKDPSKIGFKVGKNYVSGIVAAVDDSLNYDNNGNWAETVGRLMHFAGKDGAVQIAQNDQNKAQYNVDNPVNQNDINNWLNELPDADKKIVQSTSFENALKQRQKELDGASLSLNEYKNALEKVKQTEESTASDTSKTSFKKAWKGLDNNEDYKNTKKEVLELAEAGKLTDETFAKADGGNAKKYFDSMHISAEEAVKKINETVDAVKQLSSLKSGITSIRDAYTEKKDDGIVGADTLNSMEEEFGNLGKTWENYKKIAGSSKSKTSDLSKAQNKLAQAYLQSNNFLANLVDENGNYDESVKQLYIDQLQEMGIKNAEQVVNSEIQRQITDATTAYSALSEQQRENVSSASELKDMTAQELMQLYAEATGSDEAKKALLRLSMVNTNWEDLDATETYNQLIKIAEAAGIATGTIKGLQDLKLVAPDISSGNSLEYLNNTVGNSLTTGGIVTNPFDPNNKKTTTKTKEQATNEAYNDLLKKLGGGNSTVKVKIEMPNVSTAPTGGGGKGGGGKNSSSDSKTQFDWIERRITNLQTRFDRWKTITENSSLKFIDKYYKKATSYAKKLVNTEGSAYTKYLKKANGVKLNKSLKAKVRNGKISGKTSNLIKEYGSKTADKIQKYQDYYEKATSALDSFVEKAQELYNLPLDKASAKIEKFSDAIDLLEKKLDNAITATAKNKIIDDEVKEKKNTYDANKSANNKTQKNLKSAGNELKKSVGRKQKKSITKAVKNGKEVDLAKFKEGSKAYKAAVKYNAALNAKTKAQQEKDVSEQEYNYYKDIEAPKTKFDNVKDEYENKLTVIDARIQDLDNQIDNIEASGATVDNSFYKEKKKQTDQKKALLIEEKNRLTESLKGIKKNSAEWYTANDEINKVNDSIAECTKTQYELNDAIAEGNKKIFEKKLEGYQRIIDEQDFLLGLIEHEDSVDSDIGVRTDAGNARLHSYTADYYASDEKVNIATAERQRLESMKAAKEYGVGYEYSSLEALNNAINDTIKTQQENITSKYSIEKKIVDEVTKSYQAQMTVLQKLIDKKKEQLETEKDIFDYQKQISEKTKNIDTLRKQLAAMNGDTSKEAMAQKQKLQVSLNDAVDDLKDTEYDRYISDVSKMLDKLQKEYQEWQEKFLKKFDELLKEGLGIGDSTDGSYLATIAKNSGYNIQNPNANNNGKGGVNNDGSANGNTNPVKLEDNNSSNNNSSKSSSSAPKVNNKITAIGIESEETKAKRYINKNKSKSTKPLSHYSYVNQKIAALTKDKHGTYVLNTSHLKGLAKLLGVKQDGNYKKSGKLAKKLHSIGLKGFSKGGVVSVDSLNKQIRANGDDGLASVKNGEAILTPAQTEMFKQFVENMQGNLPQQNHKMSNNLANLAKVIPNNVDYGGVNFNFELNNVTNGDEFIREIQTNQKMQKALQSVTVDKINGGGRLSVNRIK